jgi:hypothetical protein
VPNDRQRPARLLADQRKAFADYVRWDVRPYSPYYGPALANGFDRLPLTELNGVDDSRDFVLRPTPAVMRTVAKPNVRLRALFQSRRRLQHEHIDPDYKPLHWMLAGTVPVGCSATDLERFAELGRRWLETAGLRPTDVLVSIIPPGPSVAFWQLSLGARRAGIAAMMLPATASADEIAALHPTVLAGRSAELLRIGTAASEVRTVLAVGEPLDGGARQRLEAALPNRASVVAAWAPPGARAVWTECPGGDAFHTWPDTELIEVLDPLSGVPVREGADGDLVWSALGWHGTVFLRLRTGRHGELLTSPCPTCGRTTPRLRVSSTLPPFATILDAEPGVAAWQAEVRIAEGKEELIVFLAPASRSDPTPLLRDLDRQLSVTQFVVLNKAGVEARMAQHGGLSVVDLR